jgi:hypothetical protein
MRISRHVHQAGTAHLVIPFGTLLGSLLLAWPVAAQTTIIVNNIDPALTGFNDSSPLTPVGGNTGTTKGQQRLIALRYAAQLWADRLKSAVPIQIDASFTKLSCSATTATLAQAGATYIFSDFTGAPLARTWYPFPLANALAGMDLQAGTSQISASFNSAVDDGSCAFPSKWYYGLDRNPPFGSLEFVSIAEHELGHGLGFQSFVDPATGSLQTDTTTGTPMNDAFSVHLFDASSGKAWGAMTDSERAASARNDGNLLWDGPAVTAKAPTVLAAGTGAGGRVKLYAPTTLDTGSSVSHWDRTLAPNELMEPYYGTYTAPEYGMLVTGELMSDMGWPEVATSPTFSWLLPSSAHAPGSGGAFYTTALSVGNRDTKTANVQMRFLGHDVDGTTGPSVTWVIPAGQSFDYGDVLASVYGSTDAWGALEISADTSLLNITSQTSTPAPGGGTFGQSVPGVPAASFIRQGSSGTITGLREDSAFRTNLILANATDGQVIVHGELYDDMRNRIGAGFDFILPTLGMVQSSHVIQNFTAQSVSDSQIVLTTAISGGAFAAYASVVDNVTNDPRTLLPTTGAEPQMTWILPSSAHAPGAGGAFYTTDLTLTNTGTTSTTAVVQFLGHDADGTFGPKQSVSVPAENSVLLPDVLGRTFGQTSAYGALRITAGISALAVSSQTSTPAPGGGTFGQSVPGFPVSSLIQQGSSRTLASLREDASFRTNLILANAGPIPITVHGDLYSSSGVLLASGDWTVPPLGMKQVGHVVNDLMGPSATLSSGLLVLSTATGLGSFAAYASVVDNITEDPRTILPQ